MDEELNLLDQETDLDDAIEAFMKSEPDEETLSEEDEVEPTETDEPVEDEEDEDAVEDEEEPEDDPEEDPEDDDEGTEEEDEEDGEEPEVASDDAEVTVTVDGEEHRVSVKELKRLYGQEASLTQKSQALSAQRRAVESQGLYLAQILQQRYEKAKAEAEKYKDVDLFRASRELDPDEFDALRAAKENAESELAALEREGQEFVKRTQETRQQILQAQAREALKEITKAIPEWNDELYGKIRTYAIAQGMDAETVNEVVDPGAIIMMHKAMKFDELQSAKPKVKKKVTKAPKKVLRKGDKPTDTKTSKLKARKRMAMESGDVDDVAELFMAAMREE